MVRCRGGVRNHKLHSSLRIKNVAKNETKLISKNSPTKLLLKRVTHLQNNSSGELDLVYSRQWTYPY